MRKSPIFAHFDESIIGASSIRAYGKQDDFITKCEKLVDERSTAILPDHLRTKVLFVDTLIMEDTWLLLF